MALPTRDRLDYQPYFRAIADRLHLRDWRVEVTDDPTDSTNAEAQCVLVYGRKWIRIRLSEKFLRDDEDRQRHTTTHELLHAHHATADRIAEDKLPADTYPAYLQSLEYGIDGLADAIAPLLPLPSEILKP
jgi:hypothetical protein